MDTNRETIPQAIYVYAGEQLNQILFTACTLDAAKESLQATVDKWESQDQEIHHGIRNGKPVYRIRCVDLA